MRLAYNKDSFVCASFGCSDPATLGAHIRTGFWNEAGKLLNLGGTPVVPCCDKHHPKNGGCIRIKATPALIDIDAPIDW